MDFEVNTNLCYVLYMKNKILDIVDHIAIQVEDINSSALWYLKNFKCELLYLDKTWAFIKFENTKLALTDRKHPPHFAVLDDSVGNHKQVVMHRDGSKSVYIEDEDGNYIELITYK